MKKYTDEELAGFMLEMRKRNGRVPYWRHFKKHAGRMVAFMGLVGLLLGLGAWAQCWWFCGFVFGLVAGIFSRDRASVRQQQAVWPFYIKVIDWLKVEKVAGGERPG